MKTSVVRQASDESIWNGVCCAFWVMNRIAVADVMLEPFETINAVVGTIDRARYWRAAGSV